MTAEEEELPGRCVLRDPNEGTLCWETCKLEGMGMCECVKKRQGEREQKKMQKQNSAQKAPLGKCSTRTLQMSSNFV